MSSIRLVSLLAAVVTLAVPPPLRAQSADEGLLVRQLAFNGNKSFAAELLGAAIMTTASSWFARTEIIRSIGLGSKKYLNEREFRRDINRLQVFYRLRGFLDVKVDTTVVRTDREVWITFHIVEGRPVLVSRFDIKGVDAVPRARLVLEDLPLKAGHPYDRTLLVATADTLLSRLRDRGYPEARTFLETPDVNREQYSAALSMAVETGPFSVIGEIHVQGTTRVDSSFVRAMLATEPGRPFSARDLAESQRNLYRSELFRFVTVGLDTAHFAAGSGVVPLTIQVSEGLFYRARASTGYGTNDCFRAGLGWTARNALGHGQVFDASAQVSKLGVGDPTRVEALRNSICSALKGDSIGSSRANYNATVSFRRPDFLSPSNTATLALFAERRSEFAVYRREDIGGSFTLNRETRSRIPLTFTYRLSYGATEANNVSFCAYFNACT
ncbi:MAG: hypothetical protein HOP28_05375 [Gemmatimonadales bacterium]|nr:hypothetical protein [Gemmatimonadales bacterium]